MADDAEELDWGGVDDEDYGEGHRTTADNDDVVSIGGEQDDMEELAAFNSRTHGGIGGDENLQETANEPSLTKISQMAEPVSVETKAEPTISAEPSATQKSNKPSKTSLVQPPLKHALPPKPITASVPMRTRNQAHPDIVGASAMSEARRAPERDRDRGEGRRRSNASRPAVAEVLPPDWEIRYSTSGDKLPYYYNMRTGVTQWERPSTIGKKSPIGTRHSDESRDSQADDRARGTSPYEIRPTREAETSDIRVSNRSTSPVLTHSDRHYRPTNNAENLGSRGSYRGRRDPSPDPLKHNNDHREPMDSQRVSRTDKDESGRRFEDVQPHRENFMETPYDAKPARDSSRVNPISERESRRDARPVQDSRNRAHRHDTYEPSRSMEQQPRPSSPTTGVNNMSLSHRRFRSRSPPPSRDTAKSHKSGEIISRDEVWDGSDGRSSHKDPLVAPRQWGAPAQNRPNVRPPSPESQSSRRSRDPEYPSRSDFGNEAKRRRLDEPVEGRPRERRDRSPIAAENRERYYPEIHPDDMAGSYRHRELSNDPWQRKRPIEDSHPGRSVDDGARRLHTNDKDRSLRREDRGAGIPSAPRQDRYMDGNREPDEPAHSFTTSSHKPEIRRNDNTKTDTRAQIIRGADPNDMMDIDIPVRATTDSMSSLSSRQPYRDRVADASLPDERRESPDRLPTGPRKMLDKRSSYPESPVGEYPQLPPQGSSLHGLPHDGEYARRESRFGSSRPPGRPAERNTTSRGQDRVEDRPSVQTRPEVEVKSSINKSSDVGVANAPRVVQDLDLIHPSRRAMITGVNSIPVPPKRAWQVNSTEKDNSSVRPSAQHDEPPNTRSSDRKSGQELVDRSRDDGNDVKRRGSTYEGDISYDKISNETSLRESHTRGEPSRRRVSRFTRDVNVSPTDPPNSESRIWISRDEAREVIRNNASNARNGSLNGSRPTGSSSNTSKGVSTANSGDSFSAAPPPSSLYDSPRESVDLPEKRDDSGRFANDEHVSRANSSRSSHMQSNSRRHRNRDDSRKQDLQRDSHSTPSTQTFRSPPPDNSKAASTLPPRVIDKPPEVSVGRSSRSHANSRDDSRLSFQENAYDSRKFSPNTNNTGPADRPTESRPGSLLERISMGGDLESSKNQGSLSHPSLRERFDFPLRRKDGRPGEYPEGNSLDDISDGNRSGRPNRAGRNRGRGRRRRSRSGLADV